MFGATISDDILGRVREILPRDLLDVTERIFEKYCASL